MFQKILCLQYKPVQTAWTVFRLQDLIFDLKILRFSESLILLGKSSHIFGPRKDIISEP